MRFEVVGRPHMTVVQCAKAALDQGPQRASGETVAALLCASDEWRDNPSLPLM